MPPDATNVGVVVMSDRLELGLLLLCASLGPLALALPSRAAAQSGDVAATEGMSDSIATEDEMTDARARARFRVGRELYSAGDFAGELQRERHDAASSRYWSSVREDRVFLAAGTTVARGCPDDWLTNPARDADGDTILNLDDVCLYEWNTPQVDSGGRARAAGPDDDEDWWPENGPAGVVGCDRCPGRTVDGGEGHRFDQDGDGLASICDSCPMHSRSFAGDVWCPGCAAANLAWPPFAPGTPIASDCTLDADHDGRCEDIEGDVPIDGGTRFRRCDNCPDGVWNVYQENVEVGTDTWGDACDNCPRLGNEDQADGDVGADGTTPLADGVGDVCDNCPTVPNPDQHDCNLEDSRLDDDYWGTPWHFGQGDACDPHPCVDRCMQVVEGDHGSTRDPTLLVPSVVVAEGIGRWSFTNTQPITARVCAVGGENETPLPAGAQPAPREFPTRVAGCWCDPRTETTTDCETHSSKCPGGGVFSGRWTDVDYDGRCVGGICAAFPRFGYAPLYAEDPTMALRGTPYDLTENYLPYYSDPEHRSAQEWNWIDDFHEFGLVLNLKMWFKPQPEGWFGGYSFDRGNTYSDPWRHVDAGGGKVDGSPVAGGLAAPGQALLPHGKQIGFPGQTPSPMQWFADILWSWLCRISDCDPRTLGWFFFQPEQRGARVGGIVLATWDEQGKSYRNITGTKLVAGQIYDNVAPSIAFAYDAGGLANRYWLFGGLDADNRPVDQMWGARRAYLDGGSVKTYADGDGSNIPPAVDGDDVLAGPEVFFELAEIWRWGFWPPARSGSTLLCTGLGVVAGQACDTVCPKVDAALALADGHLAPADDAGALLLVGGEGPSGLLDDIWLFSTAANWSPGGWRLAGHLPGVDGGLMGASFVQTGRAVWLVGGRAASGASNDIWRLEADTGAAERVAVSGAVPAGRISPAVTYDPAAQRILVFGGVDEAGLGQPDVWAFDTAMREWQAVAGPCLGDGCPAATGKEALHLDPATGELTVLADRGGPEGAKVSWTLREGIWRSRLEILAEAGTIDCDMDAEPEFLGGLRCGSSSDGYPDYGRMACDGSALACRAPVVPGRTIGEYAVGGLRTVVADGRDLYALQGSLVDVYRLEAGGAPVSLRTLRLGRAAHDIALFRQYVLAADGRGLTVYRRDDGVEVARVDTCGKARRVFAFAAGAFVLGLRSVLIVDLQDPTRPVVTADLRLWPSMDGLRVAPDRTCPRSGRTTDELWDALGPAAASWRDVAAYEDGRLFLNVLGSVYVLDFRGGATPVVSEGVPTGLLRDLRAEERFLYANTAWGDGIVLAEDDAGGWAEVSEHQVQRWVAGAVDAGPFAVTWGRGRLVVSWRQ